MKATAKVQGVPELSRKFKSFDAEAIQQIQDIVNSSAQNIRNNAIRSIKNTPATGRTYKRGSITHTASSAGNPPRNDTGRLVGTINASVGKLEAIIGAYAQYASWLEFGTRNMQPRPFMFPALEQERKSFIARMKEAIKNAIAKAGNK